MSDKSERVRVKAKYAEIVRQVASVRDESFIDALYRIIDFYWDYQNGRVGAIAKLAASDTGSVKTVVEKIPKVEQAPEVDEIDVSGFE